MKLKYIKLFTRAFFVLLLLLLAGPLLMLLHPSIELDADWHTAARHSAGIAPLAEQHDEAIVQVYAARAFNWRAAFAVHSWIATKGKGEKEYTVHQVLGWNRWYDKPVVESEYDLPDRYWYAQKPELLTDIRGAEATALIPQIKAAARTYPYQEEYQIWPGPNSNTFIAHIGRQVPGLNMNLPPTAIGKDYLNNGSFISTTPSGNGLQLSLYGALGVLISAAEGIEFNLLGLSFGFNPLSFSLRLPGIGTIG